MPESQSWLVWALLAAVFAAATAILAKIGKWQDPSPLPHRSLLFLTLSGLATGASWICYFRALKLGEASRVAPIDKLSVVLVAIFAVAFLGERPVGWTRDVLLNEASQAGNLGGSGRTVRSG